MENDVSREGFRWIKLWQFFRLFLVKNRKILMRMEKVGGLNMEVLEAMTGKKYKGVIFDFDETLAPNYGDILDENVKLLRGLVSAGLRVAIFSNMKESPRYDELKKFGVLVHRTVYPKPDVRGFQECCEIMGLKADEVLMMGDNLLTDGGAMNAGIDFILVEPVPTKERSTKRLVQKTLRKIVNAL